jgi:hypothetical protein
VLDLYEELHRVTRELDAAGVAHALVGGFAVSLHVRPRTTDDIDILIAESSLEPAKSAIAASGYEARIPPFPVAGGRLRIQRLLKTVGDEIVLIDALLAREPEHTGMLERRVRLESGNGRLWVVAREDLRALKQLRGSPQDLADLAALDEGGSGES